MIYTSAHLFCFESIFLPQRQFSTPQKVNMGGFLSWFLWVLSPCKWTWPRSNGHGLHLFIQLMRAYYVLGTRLRTAGTRKGCSLTELTVQWEVTQNSVTAEISTRKGTLQIVTLWALAGLLTHTWGWCDQGRLLGGSNIWTDTSWGRRGKVFRAEGRAALKAARDWMYVCPPNPCADALILSVMVVRGGLWGGN